MAQKHRCDLLAIRQRFQFSRLQIRIDPVENPGISPGGPPDHDAVAAGLFCHGRRFLRRIHIPVADHRDMHRLFYFADNLPVRLPGIILFPGSSMNSHRSCAAVFDDPGNLHSIFMIAVKSLTDFHRHRFFHCTHHRRHDRPYLLGIFHQRGTFPVVDHLGNRTAHIDIQDIKGMLFDLRRNQPHHLRIRSKQLQRHGTLLGQNLHQSFRIFILI